MDHDQSRSSAETAAGTRPVRVEIDGGAAGDAGRPSDDAAARAVKTGSFGGPRVTVPEVRVERVKPDAPLVDILDGDLRREVRVHEHGFVALVDVMPRLVPEGQTADAAIVQAARVSYGTGTKKVHEDRGLIRYLLRHRHTTPFEMVELKFHCAMPVFVARQWIRHRTANVNEYSARYSILPDRYYTPTAENVRKQSTLNRQGGEERFEGEDLRTAQEFLEFLGGVEAGHDTYQKLVDAGVSRELARIALPVNIYTEWYWKCDLHNTLRFLSLRLDPHAQAEIREFAGAMYRLLESVCPVTMEAFIDYELESMHLTRLEIEALRAGGAHSLASSNTREQREWDAKRAQLGL